MRATSSYGGEFEVTEADLALVAPLGTPPEIEDDEERNRMLGTLLKGIVQTGGLDRYLPTGYWDAFLDEADFVHDDVNHGDCPNKDTYCDDEAHQVWRPGTEDRDTVFVRMRTEAANDPIWDVEINTRPRMHAEGVEVHALPTINSEEYTPEQLINDLGVLLATFRLYVQQGRI